MSAILRSILTASALLSMVGDAPADSSRDRTEALRSGVILEAGAIDSTTVEVGLPAVVIYGLGYRDPVTGQWPRLTQARGVIQAVNSQRLLLSDNGRSQRIDLARIQRLSLGGRPLSPSGSQTTTSPAAESPEGDAATNEADSSKVWVIETSDGTSISGRILEFGDQRIVVGAESGAIAIPASKIVEMKTATADSIRDGKVWFKNPNPTRLLFSPTARMLKQGEGYFSDYYLFFPGLTMGIADGFTMGAGVSIFPRVDLENQLFFFGSKVGIIPDRLAAGVLVLQGLDLPTSGVLFGVTTIGQPDGSLSAGLGYGFIDGDLADRPTMMIGGEMRLSEHISLVSENHILPDTDPLVAYGMRFFARRLSVDLGFWNELGEDALALGVPYIDFVFAL